MSYLNLSLKIAKIIANIYMILMVTIDAVGDIFKGFLTFLKISPASFPKCKAPTKEAKPISQAHTVPPNRKINILWISPT